MKLLARSKSKRVVAQDELPPRAATRDGYMPRRQNDDKQISNSFKQRRSLLRKNSTYNSNVARPHTADAASHDRSSARFSLFEPFELQAGKDVFAFPKPQSARTIPPEFAAMAAEAASGEHSPTIGLAFGSPSHPPAGWHDFPQPKHVTSTQPNTVTNSSRLERVINAYEEESRDHVPILQETAKRNHTWRKFGSIFRRPTKSKPSRDSPDLDATDLRPPRKSNTEPISKPHTAQRKPVPTPKNAHAHSYKQSNAKSTAKMQSILGVATLKELEGSTIVNLTSPPPPHSRPFRRQDRPLPTPPSSKEAQPAQHHTSTSASTQSSSFSGPPPRLELALPPVQLDRYSVMFENVLETRHSIFERRRSTLHPTPVAKPDASRSRERSLNVPPARQEAPRQGVSERRGSSPLLSPALDMWMNSPLPPSPLPKDTPPQQSPRSPKLELPYKIQGLRPPQLRTDVKSPSERDGGHSRLTFFDSPSSDDDDDEDHLSPQTPQNGSPEHGKVKIFSDSASHHTTTTSTIADHKDAPTHVWHADLPSEPPTSALSRASFHFYDSPEPPSLLARSKSVQEAHRGRTQQLQRQPQVAIARSISVSRLQQTSLRTGTAPSLRPKVIQVAGTQAHSRKSSVLDFDIDPIDTLHYGIAL